MNVALNQTLSALPDDTYVYCGHECRWLLYPNLCRGFLTNALADTKGNVKFASTVDPENPAVKALAEFAEKNDVTTGKFTIGDEKQHNPFMRLNDVNISPTSWCLEDLMLTGNAFAGCDSKKDGVGLCSLCVSRRATERVGTAAQMWTRRWTNCER